MLMVSRRGPQTIKVENHGGSETCLTSMPFSVCRATLHKRCKERILGVCVGNDNDLNLVNKTAELVVFV